MLSTPGRPSETIRTLSMRCQQRESCETAQKHSQSGNEEETGLQYATLGRRCAPMVYLTMNGPYGWLCAPKKSPSNKRHANILRTSKGPPTEVQL